MLNVRSLSTDEQIADACALMRELRPHLAAETFIATIRAQMAEGYLLAGGFDDAGALIALAGYRFASTLFRGPHLFVDDLVVTASAQKRGYGAAMLAWLGTVARDRGVSDVWLDSRSTATGFYERVGFEMKKSVPCRMDAATLAARWPNA